MLESGTFRKPRIVCRDPACGAGFWGVSGEFGGNPGANSTAGNGRRQGIPSRPTSRRSRRLSSAPLGREGRAPRWDASEL